MHDIFCLHVGQCGLQIGFALWELLTVEHGIGRDGILKCEESCDIPSNNTFFNKSLSGQYIPRSIFVDLEPTVIDQMRSGAFRQLYHPDQLINGHEDAANNFSRGFHTVGRLLRRVCANRIRKEFELSNRIQGIHLYRSLGGGTGSGMTATIFEILLDYPKTSKIEIPIYPSPHLSCAIVEPYNSILSEHFCMEDIDISTLIDNESLYEIIMEQINVKEPTLHQINRLVAQVCSSLTSSSRFENQLYNDFSILTNLVPYPRIHFPLVSYAPFGSESKVSKNVNSIVQLTYAVFDSSNQLVKCDPANGKHMSCSLVYRGEISPTQVFDALASIKGSNLVRFVDWCPTGFKVGIVNQPPIILPNSHMGNSTKNVVMMTNSSSVSILWHRLAQKFHKLYSKRSFVHWFVAEGLEESEFCESLYNIATLAKDYEEVALDTKVDDLDPTKNQKEQSVTTDNNEDNKSSALEHNENPKEYIEINESTTETNGDEVDENVSNVTKTKLSLLNLNFSHSIELDMKSEKVVPTIHQTCEEVKYFSNKFDFEHFANINHNLKNDFLKDKFKNPTELNTKTEKKNIKYEKSKINQNDPNTFPGSQTLKSRIYRESKEPLNKSDNFLSDIHNKNFLFSNISENNLTLSSGSSSSRAKTESLFSTNEDESCESDITEDEIATFFLMENLVRLTLDH